MTTKKQRREALRIKRERREIEIKKSGLAALAKDRKRREEEQKRREEQQKREKKGSV